MTVVSDVAGFSLSADHQLIRRAARELSEERIGPYAADVDAQSRFPIEAYEALVATDFHAPHVPEEFGGAGADALATCLVIEEVARVCASSSLIPAVNKLGSLPLLLSGSQELKTRYLRPLAAGEAAFSYGLSEREAGSDIASMRTRAREDGEKWVLNGQKSWITNAGFSRFYTVFAVTDPEAERGRRVSAFIVEDTDEGFAVGGLEKKLGIKGSPTRELSFDNVRIPRDRMIGRPGEGLQLALRTLDHTRVTIGAQAVGIAQGALDLAVAYMRDRKQFGKTLSQFQGLQFMVADMGMQLEAARQLVYAAAARSEEDSPDLRYFGAAAKCVASDAAMRITTDAIQLLGGAGYTSDFAAERMMRDAKITQIYEGTNQVQRVVIARELLARTASGGPVRSS